MPQEGHEILGGAGSLQAVQLDPTTARSLHPGLVQGCVNSPASFRRTADAAPHSGHEALRLAGAEVSFISMSAWRAALV